MAWQYLIFWREYEKKVFFTISWPNYLLQAVLILGGLEMMKK